MHNNLKQILFPDAIKLLTLLILTVFMVYYLTFINQLFFLVLFFLFTVSKKNYFWIAFFFILSIHPVGLFGRAAAEASQRLPMFNLIGGNSFSTIDIFVLISFIKALVSSKKRYKYYLSGPLKALLFYSLLLTLFTFLIYNTSFANTLNRFRSFFYFSMIFSFPLIVKTREEVYRFVYLLFPVMIFILIAIIYYLVSGGNYLADLIDPGAVRTITIEGTATRRLVVGSIAFFYLLTIISLSFLNFKRNKNSKAYFSGIVIISFLAAFLSATRVWFIMFSLLVISYLVINRKQFARLSMVFMIGFIFLLTAVSDPQAGKMLGPTWERLSSVFTLGEESSSSTKSIKNRIKGDLPIAISAIKSNPIFGWGFSDTFKNKANSDTGNFALLVQVGFLGFFLFLYLWYQMFKLYISTKRKLSFNNPYKKVMTLFTIGLIGLLISHFTTSQIFGLGIRPLFISFFIILSEFFANEALLYDQNKSKNIA